MTLESKIGDIWVSKFPKENVVTARDIDMVALKEYYEIPENTPDLNSTRVRLKMIQDRMRLAVNMKDNPTEVTWLPSSDFITIKLINTDVDLSLDLGPDTIRQIQQALSWSGVRMTNPPVREQ